MLALELRRYRDGEALDERGVLGEDEATRRAKQGREQFARDDVHEFVAERRVRRAAASQVNLVTPWQREVGARRTRPARLLLGRCVHPDVNRLLRAQPEARLDASQPESALGEKEVHFGRCHGKRIGMEHERPARLAVGVCRLELCA